MTTDRNQDPRFNPEMLQLAREAHSLSQTELARDVEISQARLSKIEHGVVLPTDEVVTRFANRLDFPKSFFYTGERLFGLPTAFHRKRKKLQSGSLDRIHAEVNLTRMHLGRLLQAVEIEEGPGVPRLDIDEHGTPERIARMVRSLWLVPEGPIRNLVQVVEDGGGIVHFVDFASRDIDGIGVRYPKLPPLFFLNSAIAVDRMRFTLAHELGHLVMHALPTDDMEREADRFASEFLMPEDQILPYLARVNLETLAALKSVWRVSMGALLRRARDLGAIADTKYKYLIIQMGRMGIRTREPEELDLSPEPATVFPDIFRAYTKELDYSVEDLAVALHSSTSRLEEMYDVRGAGIRLVRRIGNRHMPLALE